MTTSKVMITLVLSLLVACTLAALPANCPHGMIGSCCIATLPSGQSAHLFGVAQSYAVVAGAAVTNAGLTTVSGNIGATTVTGFAPGIVLTGAIHAADGDAVAAQAAVASAYNALDSEPCQHYLTGQDMGGLALTPGVYCFASSAQLSGNVTLDGQGNTDAVFLFKMGSTLTTATGSFMLPVNGTSPCNVFWHIGSSATLGIDSAIAGNIVAYASITVTAGVSVKGRLLAMTASVSMDSNKITMPCDVTCVLSPPPLNWRSLSYTAGQSDDPILTNGAPIGIYANGRASPAFIQSAAWNLGYWNLTASANISYELAVVSSSSDVSPSITIDQSTGNLTVGVSKMLLWSVQCVSNGVAYQNITLKTTNSATGAAYADFFFFVKMQCSGITAPLNWRSLSYNAGQYDNPIMTDGVPSGDFANGANSPAFTQAAGLSSAYWKLTANVTMSYQFVVVSSNGNISPSITIDESVGTLTAGVAKTLLWTVQCVSNGIAYQNITLKTTNGATGTAYADFFFFGKKECSGIVPPLNWRSLSYTAGQSDDPILTNGAPIGIYANGRASPAFTQTSALSLAYWKFTASVTMSYQLTVVSSNPDVSPSITIDATSGTLTASVAKTLLWSVQCVSNGVAYQNITLKTTNGATGNAYADFFFFIKKECSGIDGAVVPVPVSGGQVNVTGATVVIPSGSLTTNTTLVATVISPAAVVTTSVNQIASQALLLTPHGQTFATPVQISLVYNTNTAIPAAELRVLHASTEISNDWTVVSGASINNGVAVFSASSFSVYVVGRLASTSSSAHAITGGTVAVCSIVLSTLALLLG